MSFRGPKWSESSSSTNLSLPGHTQLYSLAFFPALALSSCLRGPGCGLCPLDTPLVLWGGHACICCVQLPLSQAHFHFLPLVP